MAQNRVLCVCTRMCVCVVMIKGRERANVQTGYSYI